MTSDARNTTSPSPPAVICSGVIREREPAMFTGADDQDVEDWLSAYERVSAHNKWDDAMKLNNVGFTLRGLAEKWYLNHPEDRATWTAFKTNFSAVFDRPAVRKLRAEQCLRERAQKAGENFTSYIEDVVDLCRRVDPSMPEQDTIKHILKGIDEDAFQMLLAKNPQSVRDVISLLQSYDELRRQRRLTRRRPVEREEPLCGLALDENPSLLSRIKEFVREEVARQISLLPCTSLPSSPVPDPCLSSPLRRIIREEVAEVLPTTPAVPQTLPVAAPLYAEMAARQAPPTAYEQQTGLRRHRCAADSTADVVSLLEEAKYNNQAALLVFLDI
ncbi:uncharacterized protein LOC144168412 [Haemaphysalis longicornis]